MINRRDARRHRKATYTQCRRDKELDKQKSSLVRSVRRPLRLNERSPETKVTKHRKKPYDYRRYGSDGEDIRRHGPYHYYKGNRGYHLSQRMADKQCNGVSNKTFSQANG